MHSHGLANKLYVLIENHLLIVNTEYELHVNLVVLLRKMLLIMYSRTIKYIIFVVTTHSLFKTQKYIIFNDIIKL